MTRSKMQTQPFFFCIRPHLTHIFPKDIFPPSHWIRNCLALRGSYPQFSEHRFEALRDGQSAAVVGEMKEITRLVFFFVAFFSYPARHLRERVSSSFMFVPLGREHMP